jgi:predicted dehydrogenase
VCDVEEDRRGGVAEKYGAKTYARVEDIVFDPDVEVIDIATRSCDHFKHAKTALDAGKTVFLEKPISMTYAEAKALVELDEKYGKNKLYIRHNRRFEPGFCQVNRIIESGVLGEVYYVKRAVGNFDIRHDWQTISQYGGGQLLNWGPHLVDQALQFMGGDYVKMFSDIRQVAAAGDCEDVVHASFVGVNGRMVEIEISGGSVLPPPTYTVYGSRGALIDRGAGKFSLKYVKEDFVLPTPVANIFTPGATQSFGGGIEIPYVETLESWDDYKLDQTWVYLYEALRCGKDYPIKSAEALKVVETIEAIKSTGKNV